MEWLSSARGPYHVGAGGRLKLEARDLYCCVDFDVTESDGGDITQRILKPQTRDVERMRLQPDLDMLSPPRFGVSKRWVRPSSVGEAGREAVKSRSRFPTLQQKRRATAWRLDQAFFSGVSITWLRCPDRNHKANSPSLTMVSGCGSLNSKRTRLGFAEIDCPRTILRRRANARDGFLERCAGGVGLLIMTLQALQATFLTLPGRATVAFLRKHPRRGRG